MICLYGDSIFDNAPYVPLGTAVINHMRTAYGNEVALCARDGAGVRDVFAQIERHPPVPSDVVVLSVGGNDLLQSTGLYDGHALDDTHPLMLAIQRMHDDYRTVVAQLQGYGCQLVLCNLYTPVELAAALVDFIPISIVHTLIADHNRVIADVARQHNALVLDIASLLTEHADFSHIIEPSVIGGAKLVAALKNLI
jgi:lysophospholipase L1-like esterase